MRGHRHRHVANPGKKNAIPFTAWPEVEADVAGRLAAGPPLALSSTKRLLNQNAAVSLGQALEAEAQAQAVNFSTRDTAEAMQTFVEKREPTFESR